MSDVADRAEAALEGVTDGPWVAEYSGEQGNCVIPHDAQSTREAVCTTHLYYQAADAEFIAAARQLVPELVAELKTTRAQLAAVRELHKPSWLNCINYCCSGEECRNRYRGCWGCDEDWPCLTARMVYSADELGAEAGV